MRERTPGAWELVVSAGVDPATGRYRPVIRTIKATSKREVKAALAELEAAVAAGKVSFEDMTLAGLLERWMEHITGLGRAETTLSASARLLAFLYRSKPATLSSVQSRDGLKPISTGVRQTICGWSSPPV